MVHVKINEGRPNNEDLSNCSDMSKPIVLFKLSPKSLITKSQHPEVCTQTPMKKPNSLRGLKTEAKLAKKDMAVVKVVAAVEEAALGLKSTETIAGNCWKLGFG